MTVRFCLVPSVGSGSGPQDAIRPKYFADWSQTHPGDSIQAEWKDFGWDGSFLVGANVTTAQQAEIASHPDVVVIPANLDSNVGANLTTVQATLEALNIPADWINAGHSYRDIIRNVLKFFQYISRFEARELTAFFFDMSLETLFSDITQAQRDAMLSAAVSLNLNTANITLSMKLRQVLRIILVQLPPITLMGEVF
jgi:hypothetical protein